MEMMRDSLFFYKFVLKRPLPMRKPSLSAILGVATCLVLFCACRKDGNEQVFDELDRVISQKSCYAERFNRQADSLRRRLGAAPDDTSRWQMAHHLFNAYITYDIDSAARYSELMYRYAAATGDREMQFLSTTCDAGVQIARNNVGRAYKLILSLDTVGINKRMRANYYTQQMAIFGRLAASEGPEEQQAKYADSLVRLRHTRIVFDGHSYVTRQRLRALELMDMHRYDEALEILLPLYDPEKYNNRTLARIAYNIANAYEALGDREQNKLWLATTAISDLQTPVREYLSLYNLALLMFEEKDMERAARYIQCTMSDMLECNYNTRILHSSQAEMIINQAVVYSINSRSRILTVMIYIFMALCAIILLLLMYTLQQHRKLQQTNRQLNEWNEQIRQLNDSLRDANRIKDNYVFRYMHLATQYIGRVDQYRDELRKTAKKEGPEALMRKLRSPSDVDRDYRDFYRIFDETFLGIFPDFIEQVNALLEESARFPVRADKTLPTELRILAVMRLGITDSGHIASFLNCASTTVYTYRTRLRNSALGARNEFEKQVRLIGF